MSKHTQGIPVARSESENICDRVDLLLYRALTEIVKLGDRGTETRKFYVDMRRAAKNIREARLAIRANMNHHDRQLTAGSNV